MLNAFILFGVDNNRQNVNNRLIEVDLDGDFEIISQKDIEKIDLQEVNNEIEQTESWKDYLFSKNQNANDDSMLRKGIKWLCGTRISDFTSNSCFKIAVVGGVTLMHVFIPAIGATVIVCTGINTAIEIGKTYSNKDSRADTALKIIKTPTKTLLTAYGPRIVGNLVGAYLGIPGFGLVGEATSVAIAAKEEALFLVGAAKEAIVSGTKTIVEKIKSKQEYEEIQNFEKNYKEYSSQDEEFIIINTNQNRIKNDNIQSNLQINNKDQIKR